MGSSADENLFPVLKQSILCDGTVSKSLVRQNLDKLFSKDTYINLYSVVIPLALLGPVSRKPQKVFGPVKPLKKSRTLRLQGKLFYSHILNMKSSYLHIRSFWRIHFTVFRYRWTKNGFTDPKSLRGFRETGSGHFTSWTKYFLRRKLYSMVSVHLTRASHCFLLDIIS